MYHKTSQNTSVIQLCFRDSEYFATESSYNESSFLKNNENCHISTNLMLQIVHIFETRVHEWELKLLRSISADFPTKLEE